MHHRYSSSVSPFQAKTGTPVAAILFLGIKQNVNSGMDDYVRGCRMVLSGKNVLNKDEGSYSVISELAHTQDDQATSAPRETSVSMRTAVCIVLGP